MLSTINIIYDENKEAVLPQGCTLEKALENLPPRSPLPLAAIVNNEIQEMNYRLYSNSHIKWLDYTESGGHRIYKRSLIFVMMVACQRLFPDLALHVSHTLDNGIYCYLEGEKKAPDDYLLCLEKEMQKIVADNLPIHSNKINQEDAISFFRSENKNEKADLIAMRNKDTINLYTLDNSSEYFFGRMANKTGLLHNFRLLSFDEGFVLRLPDQKDIGFNTGKFEEPKKLQATLKEYKQFGSLLGVETVSDLNFLNKTGGLPELGLVAETMQERSLHNISDKIAADFPKTRLVLISGPSSSGKTTFTHRLGIQFRTLGIEPIVISMDDYFIDRENTPVNDKGQKDFESIEALDLNLFNQHLQKLIAGEEIQIPHYDFISGKRKTGQAPCRLEDNKIILVEGIHSLNSLVAQDIPAENKRKIYVSALTQLNMDNYTPIPSSDNRIYRRIARDMRCRGNSAEDTICHWQNVRKGENRNIFPYQENADFFFNSALIHELSVLRPLVEPALAAIPSTSPAHLEAKRLLRFIQYFLPSDAAAVPNNSILQEFIGNSIFETG